MESFEVIYKNYAKTVYKMCRAYTNHADVAQDLTQEVFIRVWQNLQHFKGESSVYTWVYRIAVNTCLTYLRKEKKDLHESLHKTFDVVMEDKEEAEKIIQLYRAIHALKETDRLLITMVLEEVPYDEISHVFGISEGNVRVRVHRIKQELTQIFFDYES